MDYKEFIKKWNSAFSVGKVAICVYENNEEGIESLIDKVGLTALDMFTAFKNGDYKYDDAFIYCDKKNIYSFNNINMVKEINYNIILQ